MIPETLHTYIGRTIVTALTVMHQPVVLIKAASIEAAQAKLETWAKDKYQHADFIGPCYVAPLPDEFDVHQI